jgi:epoxyqueuosine reductase
MATSFARDDDDADALSPGRIARYARGRDYHAVIPKRVSKVARHLRNLGHAARQSIDTMPVLERAWAQRAGLGFIGKNACLIIPGIGSHVLLSVILTDAELEPDTPMRERCGTCNACLDACPTRAFVAERQLDARRCIAYLTIEHEGAIDPSLHAPMGDWLFGCDACQDVCPFNRTSLPERASTHAFRRDARHLELGAEDFLGLDEHTFDRLTGGSPLRRAGREGMARNAAIVLGNSGNRRYLPVLNQVAKTHDSAGVREAARLAAQRLT